MLNKDYKRLTVYNEELQRPCMTADAGEQTTDTIARHVQRLYELENAIEDGTFVFLPKVVDEKFYEVHNCCNLYGLSTYFLSGILIADENIYLLDERGNRHYIEDCFFDKDKAEAEMTKMQKYVNACGMLVGV